MAMLSWFPGDEDQYILWKHMKRQWNSAEGLETREEPPNQGDYTGISFPTRSHQITKNLELAELHMASPSLLALKCPCLWWLWSSHRARQLAYSLHVTSQNGWRKIGNKSGLWLWHWNPMEMQVTMESPASVVLSHPTGGFERHPFCRNCLLIMSTWRLCIYYCLWHYFWQIIDI